MHGDDLDTNYLTKLGIELCSVTIEARWEYCCSVTITHNPKRVYSSQEVWFFRLLFRVKHNDVDVRSWETCQLVLAYGLCFSKMVAVVMRYIGQWLTDSLVCCTEWDAEVIFCEWHMSAILYRSHSYWFSIVSFCSWPSLNDSHWNINVFRI